MSKGFYSLKQIVELTTLSRATIWRQCRAGVFPRPVKLSGYRNGWLRQEVDEWVEAKVEGRNKASELNTTELSFENLVKPDFSEGES